MNKSFFKFFANLTWLTVRVGRLNVEVWYHPSFWELGRTPCDSGWLVDIGPLNITWEYY